MGVSYSRLGRYLIRIGSEFFFSCVCFGVLFGLNLCCWANIFLIAFKNINNIVKGGTAPQGPTTAPSLQQGVFDEEVI